MVEHVNRPKKAPAVVEHYRSQIVPLTSCQCREGILFSFLTKNLTKL